MKASKVILAALLLVVLMPSYSFGGRQTPDEPKSARKMDEYAYGPGSGVRVENDCEVDAHLDNFAYYLNAEPGSRGYMISYRGQRKASKYFAFDPGWQFSQLTLEWKFADGHIMLVDGGVREEAMMELWIVPEGAGAPKPTPTVFPRKPKKGGR